MKKLLLSLIIVLALITSCKKESINLYDPIIDDSIPVIDTTIEDTIIIPQNLSDTILSYTTPSWNWLIGGIFQWQPGIRPNPSVGTTFEQPIFVSYWTQTGTMDFGTDQYITIIVGRHTGNKDTIVMPIKRSDPLGIPRENYRYSGSTTINY